VDSDDIAFVALSLELDGFLWTGDKKLAKGLTNHTNVKMITTDKLDILISF